MRPNWDDFSALLNHTAIGTCCFYLATREFGSPWVLLSGTGVVLAIMSFFIRLLMIRIRPANPIYGVERDTVTGDFALTVIENGRAARVELSPPMARQLAALLTEAPHA